MATSNQVVLGLADVRKKMLLLGKQGEGIVRRAMYQGAVVIRDQARENAPVQDVPGGGTLKKAIKASTGRRKIDGQIAAYVLLKAAGTARGGKAVKDASGAVVKQKNPRKYGHLVEFGTVAHLVGKGGKSGPLHPGARPKPFLRPAYDAKKETAVAVIAENIRQNVRSIWDGDGRVKVTEKDITAEVVPS